MLEQVSQEKEGCPGTARLRFWSPRPHMGGRRECWLHFGLFFAGVRGEGLRLLSVFSVDPGISQTIHNSLGWKVANSTPFFPVLSLSPQRPVLLTVFSFGLPGLTSWALWYAESSFQRLANFKPSLLEKWRFGSFTSLPRILYCLVL